MKIQFFLLMWSTLLFAEVRPYAEYEHARTVILSSSLRYHSLEPKQILASHLPPNVKLLFLAESPSDAQQTQATFSPQNVEVMNLNSFSGFWVRDSLPLPIQIKNHPQKWGLVDAVYYYGLEPDFKIANYFKMPIWQHNRLLEGGNFAATRNGICMSVNLRIALIPDSLFQQYYGCKKMIRFPYRKGIGHIDESAKFISDTQAVTDLEEYATILTHEGFEVTLLPQAPRPFQSYVNVLLVNGTIFMPTFNSANDGIALKIYEQLGFTVVPIPSTDLTASGFGSVHCMSMSYPF